MDNERHHSIVGCVHVFVSRRCGLWGARGGKGGIKVK